MNTNESQLEKEINQVLHKMEMAEPAFQRKSLLRLKGEIIKKIDSLKMREERKSYFLHQLANVHALNSTVELIKEINSLQLMDNISQDLVHLVFGSQVIEIQNNG